VKGSFVRQVYSGGKRNIKGLIQRTGICEARDGGDMLLRNISSHTDYTALYPSRWHHS
jgi:hypothetical protein